MTKKSNGVSNEDVSEFEALVAQMTSVYDEMEKLASKKPNDAINKFKLGIVNQLLRRTNRLITPVKPLEGFEFFSEEELPSNSDVQLVLSQYLSAMEKFRTDNVVQGYDGRWYWVVDGKQSDIETTRPEKLFRDRKA